MIPIQQLIDKALENKGDHKSSGKFKPSSFGRCYRLQYWQRKGEPETNPVDDRTRRVFKAGSLFHDFVQNILLEAEPLDMAKEVLIEKDDVKGYADIVNTDEVIDIKSQHSYAFHHRQKKAFDLRKDLLPNWLQVMWYCIELKKKQGILLFVSKDDLCLQQFNQDNDDYWKKEVNDELTKLRLYWQADKLPPAQPRAYKDDKTGEFKECGYCGFKDSCDKIEKLKTGGN